MPRDVTGVITAEPSKLLTLIETGNEEFIPDIGHLKDDIVLLADGSVMAMAQVGGSPFQLESVRERNIRRRQHNELIRNISDDNVTVGAHLVRHSTVTPWALGNFRSPFARGLMVKYQSRLAGLMANDWFLTIIISPRFIPGRAIRRRLSLGKDRNAAAGDGVVRQLEITMQTVMSYLSEGGARRLGCRDEYGYRYSEIGEARRLILTGEWRPVALSNGRLGSAIGSARATCGTRAIRIDSLDGSRLCKVIAFKDYPEKTRTGQLSHMLDLAHPFVLSQTFRCQSRANSETEVYLRRTRMENTGDVRQRALEKLEDAAEDVGDNTVIRGKHNLALAVYADDMADLHRAVSDAGTALSKAGVNPIIEDGNSFAAYWTQIAGNPPWLQARSGSIDTRNLTALASFEGFPTGTARGYWGQPIIRFATTGKTAYDHHTHVGEIGHTLFIGRTGSGKTLAMNLFVCALEQPMGAGGSIVYFDKDHGSELLVRATGGAYLALRSGEASGLAPLRGLSDTPANRAFLEQWLAALMQLDGRGALKPETMRRLARGVARQLRMAKEKRSIAAVRAFLGFEENGDGERLDIWTRDGALGWVFDNDVDEVTLAAPLVGFDMTAILEHRSCPAVGAYLLHRIRDLMDGRRLAVICDECRFYLLNPLFSSMIEDFALTMRKKEGMLWLAAQQPEHITGSAIGASLISQMQTMFLFPSKTADPAEYMDKLGCTPAMYKAITEEMPTKPYRSVLMKRESGSVILKIELTDMEDEIAILSGREATTRLVPEIRAAVGDDPDKFVKEFHRRRKALRKEELVT